MQFTGDPSNDATAMMLAVAITAVRVDCLKRTGKEPKLSVGVGVQTWLRLVAETPCPIPDLACKGKTFMGYWVQLVDGLDGVVVRIE